MNARKAYTVGLVVVLLGLLTMTGSYYAVQETEQVIITQFGKPSANPVTEAGLHFKLPFIQEAHVINKQILEWDGAKSEMPTRDKLYISVDTFARWRITRPLEYFRRLRDERSAQSRLDDILGSETRNAIAKHDLIEVIRTTKDRKPETDMAAIDAGTSNIGVLPPIKKGRKEIEREIQNAATAKLSEFGIELLDVRFKRINYNPSVVEKIYERKQIASRFRSEGEGEAAKILGNKERDLSVIESGAYKTVEEIRGAADAKATSIYAAAYQTTAEARSLYEFVKTMETYDKIIGEGDTLVFSTRADPFRYLMDASGTLSRRIGQ